MRGQLLGRLARKNRREMRRSMIAALFVLPRGPYTNLPDVEAWDKARDARAYAGPYPVVAHPPCERWGSLWYGGPMRLKLGLPALVKGDDDGCFEAALAAVRHWGGVLEHPKGSSAWGHFGLKKLDGKANRPGAVGKLLERRGDTPKPKRKKG
jgi:hypothetical protein